VSQVVDSERPAERPVLGRLIQETASKSTSDLEKCLQSLEDKLKAATLKNNKSLAKNEKGDGTRPPKSILRKKGKPAAQNQLPNKKSASSSTPAQGDNSNATARDDKKKKPKKRHVSFDGNKDAHCTNSRK
jgi:hypothetical protein